MILKKEISNRSANHERSAKFTTRSLKYFSLICIISGVLRFIFGLFEYINGLCTFSAYVAVFCWSLQGTSMGYYQLSRLYYCFANEQVHSNKGYPKYVFIIMYILGLIHLINYPLSAALSTVIGSDFFKECSYIYNSDVDEVQFVRINVDIWSVTAEQDWIWFQCSIILFIAWDLSTLCLYIYKTLSLKSQMKESEAVSKRISNILNKIIILTIMYQLFFFLGLIISSFREYWNYFGLIGWSFSNLISSMAMIISMYLMMDYNKKDYVKFIKLFKRFCFCLSCSATCCDIDNDDQNNDTDESHESTNAVPTTKRGSDDDPGHHIRSVQRISATITVDL